jgi:NAD(P)-dependent dehydrogenase (short-subunit alcohol dehydrogenase family)
MLGLEMSLEADLGIDSIKRVEIMAALQQALPQAEPVAPERLGSLVTLQDVLAALGTQAVRSPVTAEPGVVATKRDDVPQADGLSVDELVMRAQPVSTEPWRVEPDALVWIAHQGVCDLSAALVKQLTVQGTRAQAVDIAMPEAWPEATGLHGLVLVAPANQVLDSRSMYQLTQHVAPVLRAAKQGFVIGITRMDGAFGLRHASGNESSGALSGLVKGLAWEWPALRCRVLDVDADQHDREAMAAEVLPELWRKGPLELGLAPQGQCVLELAPSRTRTAASAAALAPKDVVLVTGGARGVTAACAIALAEALRPTLVLLGRSPLPGAEASWLAGCDDEAAIKQALRIHEPACNTPRLLQQRAQVILAEKAIRETLSSINQLGVPVHYVSVDVRDASAVNDAVTTVRQTLGPIRGLIHGAGVIADRLIHEKSIAQFDAVFETKVVGLQAIMAAIDPRDLKALILFSSVTGRQGRSGQSDYAMANEWLNKFAQAFARRHPACLVRALNWGPWDGGMVTRAHKRLFAAEGVGVVPLEAGARWLAQTLGSPVASGVEQVILGTLSEAKAVASKQPEVVQDVFAFELDPTRDAWLDDHRLRGRSVLPAALMIDWLLLAASLTQPGLSVRSLRHFTVLKGLVLDESRQSIHGVIEHTSRNGETTAVQAALVTRGHDGQTVRHASAELEVGEQLSQDVGDVALALPVGRYPLRIDDAYGRHLFHGATWRGIERITAFGLEGVAARLRCAPVPQAWLSETLQETWMADPLVIDCVFQLLILWSVHHLNAPCLPARVGSLERYFEAFPSQGCDVVISCVSKHPHELVATVELRDGAGLLLARMQDVVATVSAQLVEAFGVEASVPR